MSTVKDDDAGAGYCEGKKVERERAHERERCKQKGGRAKRNGRIKKRVILMGTREIHLQT